MSLSIDANRNPKLRWVRRDPHAEHFMCIFNTTQNGKGEAKKKNEISKKCSPKQENFSNVVRIKSIQPVFRYE